MNPTQLFELTIGMVMAIIALHYAAHRLNLPPSVALLAGGSVLAFVPGLPTIKIDPALVLVIFLPPLLLDGAWSTPMARLRRHMWASARLGRGRRRLRLRRRGLRDPSAVPVAALGGLRGTRGDRRAARRRGRSCSE